jgi:hypothetical protein
MKITLFKTLNCFCSNPRRKTHSRYFSPPASFLFYFKQKYGPKKKDVATFKEEFRFQPEIGRSSRGHGSIRLGPKTRRGGTLVSISDMGEE